MSADLGSTGLWLAMIAGAAMNYAVRVTGFYLMRHVRLTPFVKRALRALPSSVILATVLPIAVHGGVAAALCCATAIAVMAWRGNDILAVACGIAVAALSRAFLV